MGLLSRLVDLFQAKTHKLLNALENPQDSLDLSYEKMIAGLQETKRHLADVVTERSALERQIAAATAEVSRAETDARTAMAAAREDLARAALRHKQAALEKIASLQNAHNALSPQVDRLIGYQRTLEERIEKFRTDKEVMKSSYAAAQAQVKVTESLGGIGQGFGNVGETMRRAKDQVEHMQARADGMGQMLEQGLLSDPHAIDATDRELQELRSGSAIEADMARLRAELSSTRDGSGKFLEGKAEPSAD